MKKIFSAFFILVAVWGCALKVYHYDQPTATPGRPLITTPIDTSGDENVSNLVTPPRGTADYQIAARAPYDSVLVLSNEWNTLSAKYGLGRWRQLRPLVDSLVSHSAMMDHDWYEEATTTAPNAITDKMFHLGNSAVGSDGPYEGKLNILQDGETYALDLKTTIDGPFFRARIIDSPDYSWQFWTGDAAAFLIGNMDGTGDPIKFPFIIENGASHASLGITQTGSFSRVSILSEAGKGCLELNSLDNFGTPLRFNNTYDDDWFQSVDDDNDFIIGKLHGAIGPTPVSYITILPGSALEATASTSGYINLAQYPNTRDDGTPTTIFGSTNAAGTVGLFPVTDLPFMQSFDVAAQSGGPTTIDDGETLTVNGAGINSTSLSGNTLTITGTEVDGSVTNEIQTLDVSGTGPTVTLDLSSDASDPTITGAGIAAVTASGNAITITATEVDGSTTNELQTLNNTSDATSHTVTLSNSGGSTQFVEGANITLTTTGTAADGIVTIAATGGADTDDQNLTIEGAGPTYDIAIDNGTDVSVAGAGIITLSESPANTLVITGTEVDGSTSNEIQDITVTGASQPFTLDLSSDATDATLTGAGISTITRSGNAMTITSTEVDGSTTNELQTLANTSNATSHTVTLSNSGGSTQLIEGTDITLTTGGTGLNGTVTIASTGTDDQALTFDGGSGPVGLVIDNVPGSIDFIEGSGISLTSTATTMTITATGGTSDADWLEESLGTPPNSINDNMYTGTGEHGIGTTTPDKLLDIAASAATGPFVQLDYTTGTDAGGVMGSITYAYGNEDMVKVQAQKQTNNSNNDAEYRVQMEDDGGTMRTGLQLDYETGTVVDKPRLQLFGGLQHQNWRNVATTTTMDEGDFGIRVTASGQTITLPNLTITNNEGIGTIVIVYNQSGGNITIDPGSASDTVNGSSANFTLPTLSSRIFICTFIGGSNETDWISFN